MYQPKDKAPNRKASHVCLVTFGAGLLLLWGFTISNNCKKESYHNGSTALAHEAFSFQAFDQCNLVHVGGNSSNKNYGAWPACSNAFGKNPVVYSFGIGRDVSFDIEMVTKYNAKVFCYDPTISVQSFDFLVKDFSKKDRLKFTQFGLGRETGVINFYKSLNPKIASLVSTPGLQGYNTSPYMIAPVMDPFSVLKMNGHMWLDVLKVDIETAEFELFEDLQIDKLPVTQLLVEFHARLLGAEGWSRQDRILKKIQASGFKKMFESSNHEEIVFLRVVPPV